MSLHTPLPLRTPLRDLPGSTRPAADRLNRNRPSRGRRTVGRCAAFVALAGAIVSGGVSGGAAAWATSAGASPVSAAHWLLTQQRADGALPNFSGTGPDYAATTQFVIGLAGAGASPAQIQPALDWLSAHIDSAAGNPARLALTILAVRAAGGDPMSFASHDLVADLLATKSANGLFGSADPTFDGAFRQGLALLALGSAAATVPADAVDWLIAQQCSSGLWSAFRADVSVPCPDPDPDAFVGPDSNSTALAVLGLAATGSTPTHDPVAALLSALGADGGWAYIVAPGVDTQASDVNSTALVVAALGAAAPSSASAFLATLQIPCGQTNAGAFGYQAAFPNANLLATVQAVPALTGGFAPAAPGTGLPADPCQPTTTSSTSTTSTSTTSTSSTTTSSATTATGATTSSSATTSSTPAAGDRPDFAAGPPAPRREATPPTAAVASPVATSGRPAFTGTATAGLLWLAVVVSALGATVLAVSRRSGRRSRA